ncbi:MAG: hypothetical protein ACJ72D_08755, partial [Marmoricola sp.]
EADLADAVTEHLERRADGADQLDVVVTSRVVAAAVFGAMEVWMQRESRSMADLADITQATLTALEAGLDQRGMFRHY